ncbi:hypothetical protein J6590_025891 [Homalodisca vitripennis]|nr:hypothetical protein J6590_025891 [Homalodisca vitripennis]
MHRLDPKTVQAIMPEIMDNTGNLHMKTSRRIGDEEAQNGLFASILHKRHVHYKMMYNLDEEVFSLSHRVHNWMHLDTFSKHGGVTHFSSRNVAMVGRFYFIFRLVQRLKSVPVTDDSEIKDEAQNEFFATFRHQRHLDCKRK